MKEPNSAFSVFQEPHPGEEHDLGPQLWST